MPARTPRAGGSPPTGDPPPDGPHHEGLHHDGPAHDGPAHDGPARRGPAGGGPLPRSLPPGGPAARRVTIRDVAAHAGVSIGTASKALNGQGKLRAETRDRVAAAALALGFAPNVLARGLLAGRTYTVGVITTDSFGRFSIPMMLGAEDALGAGQISVFMCDTRDEPDRERRYLEMLLSRRVDGLIVAGRRIEPRPSIGLDLGVPVVYAMTQSMDSDERHPAGRHGRGAGCRRAPAGAGPAPPGPYHRPGAVPGRPQAGPRVLRRGGRGRDRLQPG